MTKMQTTDKNLFQVPPMYSTDGIQFYNICHLIDAMEADGEENPFDAGVLVAAATKLDAVIFGYPREYPGFRPGDWTGIAYALRHGAGAVVWDDMS